MALDHASLGQIQGVRPSQHPGVEQYLGIQYAKLENAFARGVLVEKPDGPVDATATGQVWRPFVSSPVKRSLCTV